MNALDTKGLVYAVRPSEGKKEKVARSLLARAANANWPIPATVYGEFFASMKRR